MTVAALALLTTSIAKADDASDQAARDKALAQGGPWHYRSFRCVDTTVTDEGPRLEGMPSSGSTVGFATTLGFEGVKNYGGSQARAAVVSYDTVPAIAAERKGDRVQVCLLSISLPIDGCDPDKDARGRTYRVYDYHRHHAYSGMSSEHDCGGA